MELCSVQYCACQAYLVLLTNFLFTIFNDRYVLLTDCTYKSVLGLFQIADSHVKRIAQIGLLQTIRASHEQSLKLDKKAGNGKLLVPPKFCLAFAYNRPTDNV